MSFFAASSWLRGSIRTSNPIRYNIRTNNSRLFMRQRFFHSQNCIRPSLQNAGLKRPKASSLFWAYLNAPGNMLFLTTNMIGLGILVTYRCLYTLANHDRLNQYEQSLSVENLNGVRDFDYSGDRFNLLRRHLEEREAQLERENLELAALEKELDLDEMTEEEMNDPKYNEFESHQVPEFDASAEFELPLTEMDLDQCGPPVSRKVNDEKFNALLIDQLLSVYAVHDYLNQIFTSETPNMKILDILSVNAKEGLISALYDIVNSQNEDISQLNIQSFDDFYRILPLKQIGHYLKDAYVSDLKYELLKYNASNLHDEDLENLKIEETNETLTTESIKSIINQDTQYDVDVYLNLARHLINSKISTRVSQESLFSPIVEMSNKDSNKKKFTNISIILNNLFFKTQNFKTEKFHNELMKSSILHDNRIGFFQGLKHLNLDEESLNRYNMISSKNMRKVSKSHESGITFSVKSYITAIRGLITFNAPKVHIQKAMDKVLKSLVSSGNGLRVLFTNRGLNLEAESLVSRIPVELFEVFVLAAKEYKDSKIFNWCVQSLDRHMNLSSKTFQKSYDLLKDTATYLENEELLQRVDEVYNKKLHNNQGGFNDKLKQNI